METLPGPLRLCPRRKGARLNMPYNAQLDTMKAFLVPALAIAAVNSTIKPHWRHAAGGAVLAPLAHHPGQGGRTQIPFSRCTN